MFQVDSESRRLVDALEGSRGLIVVLTGAGISLASGIPTFRGSDPGNLGPRHHRAGDAALFHLRMRGLTCE